MQLYRNFCTEEFDSNGVLKNFELDYKEDYNFGYDVVDELAKHTPDETALIWCDTFGNEKIFTYRDISVLSNKTANVLAKYGVKKGDRVLVMLKRNYEYWYVAPALHKLGAILIPATHMLTTEDIVYRVNAANISYVICTSQNNVPDKLLEAKKQTDKLKTIFGFRQETDGIIDMTSEVSNASADFERVPTLAKEPMIIYFTSGTTGYPKAVEHDHTYTLSHIITARFWQCVKDGGLHLTVAETGWGKASWGKIYGQWLCGCAVMVYDFDTFTPRKLLSMMEKYKVTSFCAPPTVYRYFIKRGMDKHDLSTLEHLTTAGEAINPLVVEEVFNQTGLHIAEGFGQTETTLLLAKLENDNVSPQSMGKPTPLYDVRIQKSDGTFASPGENGEIVIIPKDNQHGIFMGYYDNDELYKKVWDGGVYHTGDVGYRDENNCFFYVSRIDDVIKSRGFRIGPFEIENAVMEHPAVLECAVTGIPNKEKGQAILATIVLNKNYTNTPELLNEIKTVTNARLAHYKHIHQIECVDEMPKTISGKVRRVEIKENFSK